MTESKSRSPWVVVLLILLPTWLVGSAGFALWYYFYREKKEAAVDQERFVTAVSVDLLEDDLRKLVTVIGERNTSSETASANLSRASSMIEGLLGPTNTGYPVQKIQGPAKWPILQVTIRGKKEKEPALWIIASYDSPVGSRGAETNASGLASALAAAQALAADKPEAPIHFAFIPHANDPAGPLEDTANRLVTAIKASGTPKAILSVEVMGAREELWLTSDQPSLPPVRLMTGLGSVSNDAPVGIAASLAKAGLPAARVSTHIGASPAGDEERPPFGPTIAGSTGRLIELIRRCAAK